MLNIRDQRLARALPGGLSHKCLEKAFLLLGNGNSRSRITIAPWYESEQLSLTIKTCQNTLFGLLSLLHSHPISPAVEDGECNII